MPNGLCSVSSFSLLQSYCAPLRKHTSRPCSRRQIRCGFAKEGSVLVDLFGKSILHFFHSFSCRYAKTMLLIPFSQSCHSSSSTLSGFLMRLERSTWWTLYWLLEWFYCSRYILLVLFWIDTIQGCLFSLWWQLVCTRFPSSSKRLLLMSGPLNGRPQTPNKLNIFYAQTLL